MEITAKYHFDDRGWRRLTSAVSRFSSSAVDVGILGGIGSQMHPNGKITIWEIGAINEFGSRDGHTPERSFLRSAFQDRSWVRSITALAARRVLNLRGTAEDALNWMGGVAVHAVRQKIDSGPPPPNAPSTVQKKGFDHPLFEIGVLRSAISHQVTRNPVGQGVGIVEHFLPGED